MNPIKKILELLNTDRSGEGKTNNLIILTRDILAIVMVYFAVLCFFCLTRGLSNLLIWYVVTTLGVLGALIVSFFMKRADLSIILFMIFIIILSLNTEPTLGVTTTYTYYLFMALMLFWYDSGKDIKMKVFFTAVIACVIAYVDLKIQPDFSLAGVGQFEHTVFAVSNIIIFCICISLVAYTLCAQSVKDERKLIMYNEKLKHEAGLDPLTGLMNRRAIGEKFEELSRDKEAVITVAIGDIDFFKRVNDTRGHDCGDFVLKSLADLFKEFMADKGYISRWGGEEFLFVFSSSNGDEAYTMLESLRKKIQGKEFVFFDHKFSITMTFGVEEYSARFGTEEAIKSADKKLYLGKESGRNKVVY